jgi:hypothetical protein
VSSLWTPGGERPVRPETSAPAGAPGPEQPTVAPDDLEAIEQELAETRRRLAEVPAQVVVLNHAMGLYELAAIHLAASPPQLTEAALALDAFACLVEGLAERLGPDVATMRDALAQIRLAFVQIKGAAG